MADDSLSQDEAGVRFREQLLAIMERYPEAQTHGKSNDSPIRAVFQEAALYLLANPAVRSWNRFAKTKYGYGQAFNKWAKVPWLALLNPTVTTSPQRGIYIAFLFPQDMSGVYVTLALAATEASQQWGHLGAAEVRRRLRERATRLRAGLEWLEAYGYQLDNGVNLKTTSGTGIDYEHGTIAYQFYPREALPDGGLILHALQPLLTAYDDVVRAEATSARPGRSTWCIYVPRGTRSNFDTALEHRVWGAVSLDRFEGIREGDEVLFVQEMSADPSVEGRGFPRVELPDFVGTAAQVVRATVASEVYEDHTPRWPDAEYPFRFDFEVQERHADVPISDETYPLEVIDAIRRSAVRVGRPQRVQPLADTSTDDSIAPATEPELKEPAPSRPIEQPEQVTAEAFSIDDALAGLFLERSEVEEILRVLARKRNLILQGPPGVGKTFVAQRIAYAFLGRKDPSRIELVQFHQSYAYEDFVQGWRPASGSSFTIREGIFVDFCQRAGRSREPHIMIIDEINRANVSKVFGELLMLIEGDKRGPNYATTLAYGGRSAPRFFVPSNVYVLGLMNTADRSLAFVDYALRRRFGFVDLSPAFSRSAFSEYLVERGVAPDLVSRIVGKLLALNEQIASDSKNLGPGYQIGHSYFVPTGSEESLGLEWYSMIIRSEIAPLLREYWFDDTEKVSELVTELLA